MSIDPTVTRRALLAAGAGTAGIAALAACSSSSSGSSGSSKPTGDGDGNSAKAESPGGGGASSRSGGDSGGGAALATLSSVPVGEAIAVKLPGGKPGILARPTSTTAACFSAICTHMGCTVKPAGKTLNCPCHGSKYNALTGAVINGPAPAPLHKVSVTVQDGKVVPA